MTTRYLVIAGGNPDQRDRVGERVQGLDGLMIRRDDTMIILSTTTLLLGARGPCVIGELFQGAQPVQPALNGCDATTVTVATMVARHWGRYVALWIDPLGRVQILRDPSGALPCYYRTAAGLTFVASDMAMLDRALPLPRALNWPEIARILGAGDLRAPATAICDVQELSPGNVLTIAAGRTSTSPAWDPWQFMTSGRRGSMAARADELRARVGTVMTALAQAHPAVVATISGGLDSSIVALAIAPLVTRLTCVTMTSRDPSGDERRYARMIAAAAAADYHERLLDGAEINLDRSQVEHLPRPVGRPFFQPVATAVLALALNRQASAIINGTGGDNVFCSLRSATPVVDRLRSGQMGGAVRSLVDVAKLTNASVGEVAFAALRKLIPRRRPALWRTDRRFLSNEQQEQASHFVHPWLHGKSHALPGQLAHLTMLLRVQNYLEPWQEGTPIEILNPLLAQPIVEFCLSIPSWQWCDGGADRALARAAFADLLPPPILHRRWKGGPDGFIGELVSRNRTFLRQRLLDGVLADRRLLDRAAIAAVLDDPRPPTAGDSLRLLVLTDAEAWVRHHR